MTLEEAKAILLACRLDTSGADDAQVEQALALMAEYPELAEWFARESLFDAAFCEKLDQITPPAGLKDAILAAHAPSGAEDSVDEKTVPFPTTQRNWWQNPNFISIAACVVLVFTFGFLIMEPSDVMADPDLPDFYDHATANAHYLPELDIQADSLEDLEDFLEANGHPGVSGLLPTLQSLAEVGAQKHFWMDTPVSLIGLQGPQQVHKLYVIDMTIFGDDDTPPAAPYILQQGPVALLVWSHNSHLYVLTHLGSASGLEMYMAENS